MDLNDLEIYQLSLEISQRACGIYKVLHWQDKKVIGDQFITAVNSIGANIAEGFGRYHYLDKNKFNLNARGSYYESMHHLGLLIERGFTGADTGNELLKLLNKFGVKLNNYITTTIERKQALNKIKSENYVVSI